MFNYDAPNPYPETKSFLSSWLSWIPYFGSSLSSSAPVSRSETIGKLILPAQTLPPKNIYQLHMLKKQHHLNIHNGTVNTHDGATLDSIQLTPVGQYNVAENEKRYVVKFNGNMAQYENALDSFAAEAEKLNVSVIGFNFRGVGKSTKTPDTFQTLVTDGIAQVQRLLKHGANPENITIDGISLGGAIATMVASHFHERGIKVYLFNDRSLSRVSAAAAGMLAPEFSWPFGDMAFSSIETTSWSILTLSGWQANLAQAYNSIPEQYKTHMYVAKASDKSKGDGVIAHPASLHKGVKAFEKNHDMNTGHKVYAHGFFGGHNQNRSALECKGNAAKNGLEVYENFVLRKR